MNLSEKLLSACGKPVESCTNRELYEALLTMVQQEACSRTSEEKSILYFSRISDWKAAVKQPD